MKILITICLCLASLFLVTEKNKIGWERKLGGFQNEVVSDLYETCTGEIMVTVNKYGIGNASDVFTIRLDEQGRVVQKLEGDYGKVNSNCNIASLTDGVITGGYKKVKGKKYLWILNHSNEGYFWEYISNNLGIAEDLERLHDGTLLCAGNVKNKPYLLGLSEQGDKLWERTIDINGYSLKDVLVRRNDIYILLSNDSKSRIIKLNYSNVKEGHSDVVSFEESTLKFQYSNRRFTILCKSKFSRRADLHLLHYDLDNDTTSEFKYATKTNDRIADFIVGNDDKYYLFGHSNRHLYGARRHKLWLHSLTEKATPTDLGKGINSFGSHYEDSGKVIKQLSDGDLIIAGSIGSGLSSDQIYIKRIPRTSYFSPIGHNSISIDNLGIYNENKDAYCDAEESANLSLAIHNTHDKRISGLHLRISEEQFISKVSMPESIVIGSLQINESKVIGIPINVDESADSGINSVTYNVLDGQERIIDSIMVEFESKRKPRPNLEISNYNFKIPSGMPLQRLRTAELELTITNTGELAATETYLRGYFPDKTKVLKDRLEVGYLEPGDTINASFVFMAGSIYESSEMNINVHCWEATRISRIKKDLTVELLDFKEDWKQLQDADKLTTKKIIEFKDNSSNSRGGPNPANLDYDIIFEEPSIEWVAPDPFEYQSLYFDHPFNYINVKLRVEIDSETKESDFAMLINGEILDSDFYIEEPEILLRGTKAQYISSFYLREGKNNIRLQVGDSKSETFTINYKPVKPNLFVHSFGVAYSGKDSLKFSTKDAVDLAEAIKKQKGSLYKDVKVKIYNKKNNTSAQDIRKTLEQIEIENLFEDKIARNDLLVLFFSGHGITYGRGGQFRLAGSDFTSSGPKSTSVNFEDYVLEMLENLECNKLVLLDACHSGSLSESVEGSKDIVVEDVRLSKILFELSNTYDEERMLLSCSPGELSYEDDLWQNGAFTEALLECINSTDKESLLIDNNSDGYVSFNETYSYVKMRVPAIIKEAKNLKGRSQTPSIIGKDSGIDRYLFKIEL